MQVVGRIDQQSWGEGESRQYKTALVASEIVLLSQAAAEEAPPAADEPAPVAEQLDQEPAADAADKPQPRRRRKSAL